MTKVTLTARRDKSYVLKCTGHASGYPNVCAAISMMTQTLAGWIANGGGEGHADIRKNDAYAYINWRCGKHEMDLFDFLCIGFLQLEKSYPEALSVEIKQI